MLFSGPMLASSAFKLFTNLKTAITLPPVSPRDVPTLCPGGMYLCMSIGTNKQLEPADDNCSRHQTSFLIENVAPEPHLQ